MRMGLIAAVVFQLLLVSMADAARSCDEANLGRFDVQQQRADFSQVAGFLILDTPRGQFLVEGNCVVIEQSDGVREKRQRFLQFFFVNAFTDQEPQNSFIQIQVIRLRDAETNLIRMYRNGNWVDEDGKELPKVPGRVSYMDAAAWNDAHSVPGGSLAATNTALSVNWHALPEPDAPSSWDFRQFWSLQNAEKPAFVTNLLIRFAVNTDPTKESLVRFQVGFPSDELMLRLGSNIDAMEREITIRFVR